MFEQMVQNFTDNGLPLDAPWLDVDYLDNDKDFTIDQDNFKGLGEYVNGTLHAAGKRFVPIISPGIVQRANQGYEPYDDGVNQDIFLKAGNDQIFTGMVRG